MVSGDNDDYNYTYYDESDGLSVEEQAADVLWNISFSDNTLTVRDAELGASKLAEAGLLADDDVVEQWGVGTVSEQGKLVVVATPSRTEADQMCRRSGGKIMRREVTEWEIEYENDPEDV